MRDARRINHLELVRFYRNIASAVEAAPWKKLSEDLSSVILGYSLVNVYVNWQAINNLFQFRNILAHGGLIINRIEMMSDELLIEKIKDEKRLEYMTKKELFNYLFKEGLIVGTDRREAMLKWKLFNSKISDFFVYHSMQFLLALFDKVLDGKEPSRTMKTGKLIIQNL